MTPERWHTDTGLLTRYVRGAVDDATAWSIETHVTACAACRARLDDVPFDAHDEAALKTVWAGVEGEVRSRPRVVERLLVALGVRDDTARLLAATPSLTASWLLAVAAVLSFAVVSARLTATEAALAAGDGVSGSLPFLLIAPLVPLAGVAAAFGPRVDPTYEVGLAAPIRGPRLLFVRATAVLAVSVAIAAVAAMFLPQLGWSAAAWILPALAVSATALAASTWTAPLAAAVAVGVTWVAIVLTAEAASAVSLAAFRANGQWTALVAVVAGALVVVLRRDHFDIESGS